MTWLIDVTLQATLRSLERSVYCRATTQVTDVTLQVILQLLERDDL